MRVSAFFKSYHHELNRLVSILTVWAYCNHYFLSWLLTAFEPANGFNSSGLQRALSLWSEMVFGAVPGLRSGHSGHTGFYGEGSLHFYSEVLIFLWVIFS